MKKGIGDRHAKATTILLLGKKLFEFLLLFRQLLFIPLFMRLTDKRAWRLVYHVMHFRFNICHIDRRRESALLHFVIDIFLLLVEF